MSEPLRITGLTAGYGRRTVVHAVDLAPIQPGEVVSLVGPNGAGKTTLLRALAGLHPARGSIHLGQKDLLSLSLADHAKLITYMPQSLPQRVALTALETVIGALRASGGSDGGDAVERALDVIELVGIGDLAMVELDHLSGGQRQLVSFAQALARSPRVLLLDEPISALDLHYQLRVMKLLRAQAKDRQLIVIMVLHDLSIAARWSDRIVVMRNGSIVADGEPCEAISASMLAEVYGVAAEVGSGSTGLNLEIHDIIEAGPTGPLRD